MNQILTDLVEEMLTFPGNPNIFKETIEEYADKLAAAIEDVIGPDVSLDGEEYTDTLVVGSINKVLGKQRERLYL